ncbi:NUDIX hydrolase [Synechocystis sp. FACHB-383]|uniref:NUDIX domain-containing protein n=1 Tax=Synechocystis sp. FACHB-383 TaxID=2692864 RepID=UPI0016870F7C|nr:NUDIX hydrolase [Synechocystis sp. FACHB-383]
MWRYAQVFIKLLLRRPLSAVTLIPVLPSGSIVLVKRRDTGQWSLPGGLIDWRETVTITAARELREETGLQLIKIDRLLGVYSSPDRDPRMHSVTISLVVQAAGNLLVGDRQEVSQVQAFTVEDLPLGSLSHDHDQQLQDYLQGETIIA